LGYIGIVQHKEHSPEVLSIHPGTPCMYMCVYIYIYVHTYICRSFATRVSQLKIWHF